ncbi:MAG: hypothetical protein AAFV29_25915, partial [Myxococcota bacterium]
MRFHLTSGYGYKTPMDRSHWGWGYAHKFGDRDTRQQLGQAAQAGLGFAPTALEDPVAIETIALPDAAVMPPSSASLASVIETFAAAAPPLVVLTATAPK